jgi:hypothetical protein
MVKHKNLGGNKQAKASFRPALLNLTHCFCENDTVTPAKASPQTGF